MYQGYFEPDNLPVGKGDEIIVPKGASIFSINPQDGPDLTAGRTYKVAVHHVLPGFERNTGTPEARMENPEVRWAGSGGYWKGIDINDARLIPEYFRARMCWMAENHPEGVFLALKNLDDERLQELFDQPTLEKLLRAPEGRIRQRALRFGQHVRSQGRSR